MAGALAWVALTVSCDKMNDIHQKYFDEGERVHLAKPDSAIVFPGAGRVKLSWFINADPKVETTVIFWNLRQDSIEKTFTRINDEIQQDSVIVNDLPEDSYVFELVNKNSRGERSLTTIVEGRSYGEKYINSLMNRSIVSTDIDDEESSLTIEWSESLSAVNLRLDYMDIRGANQTLWVDISETTTTIPDFMIGEPLYCTTFHKPDSLAIDIFQAPTVIIPYVGNITAQKLKNTVMPFDHGEAVITQAANEYYTATDWKTNPVGGSNGNVFRAGSFNYALCMAAWAAPGWPSASITNGKLFQTVELDAGMYTFTAYIYYSDGEQGRYVAVALGNDLPNTNDVRQNALAYESLAATGVGDNLPISVDFELLEKSFVSLGFVADLDNAEMYFGKVELLRKFQ